MWPSASFVREPEHKYSYLEDFVRKIELNKTISNIFFENMNLE